MKRWVLLTAAIVCEVAATLSLRASVDHPGWIALVVTGYVCAFILVGFTLRTGMSIGAVYGIWGAIGVALVAVLGVVLFGEHLTLTGALGLAVIIAGVVCVETGSKPTDTSTTEGVSQ